MLPNYYFFHLSRLVYLVISYPNDIFLATLNKVIYLQLVEIKILIDIYSFHKCLSFYFDIFDILNNYKEMFFEQHSIYNFIFFFILYLTPSYKDD